MTVGWIREGDLDAFYEGTEQTPDPAAAKQPLYSCPFCSSVFGILAEFHDHVYTLHRVDRPLLLMGGREPAAFSVIRSRPDSSEIIVENASHAFVSIDGSHPRRITVDGLMILISSIAQGELTTEIVSKKTDNVSPVTTTYNLSFRIAQSSDLQSVEQAFRNVLASEAITIAAINNFLEDPRAQGPGKEYAVGLAEYCLGVLVKERPEGERLTTPFSRYRDHYGRALNTLKDFPRPLSRLISSLIRFSLNDFESHGSGAGFSALDLAIELLSDPASARPRHFLERSGRSPICPIDHGTGLILELAKNLTMQPRWSPILDAECRGLANSYLVDLSDRQKAYAIWAASAWRLGATGSVREPLTQIAGIYPFSRWASHYLEQVST